MADRQGQRWLHSIGPDFERALAHVRAAIDSGRHVSTADILLLIAEQNLPGMRPLRDLQLGRRELAELARTAATGDTDTDERALEGIRNAVLYAHQRAVRAKERTVTTEHLVWGIAQEARAAGGRVLVEHKVSTTELANVMPLTVVAAPVTKAPQPLGTVLSQFGRSLTEDAAAGRLDPVIGREAEIERTMVILGRRTKSNVVLLGEPGVGKTAILEGLAQRIVKGQVPETLQGKHIFLLDVSSLVAGSRYRGDFEERAKKVIKELAQRDDLILAIDEVHAIRGAGSAGGSIDLGQMLKQVLARPGLQSVAGSTLDEWRKRVQNRDAALARRFQPVIVNPPSVGTTQEILAGLAPLYEAHHGVTFAPGVLAAAGALADRYIADRFLPDKAIDLIDEAAAMVNLRALRERRGDPVGAGGIEAAPPVVTKRDIAAVIKMWNGISVDLLDEDNPARWTGAADTLAKRVIGQPHATRTLGKILVRRAAGLRDPVRPVSVFAAGPTGVGKTELFKGLAEFLFGSEDALIKLDMSEFMEKHSVSRLTGAAPGYVGFEEGGQLTERVRRNPYSVILFDEIEKAHPDVANVLLQVLEDGRLTDSQGRVVDFSHAIIGFSSNLGSQEGIKAVYGFGNAANATAAADEQQVRAVKAAMSQHFRPEFINRLDEVLIFDHLSMESSVKIVDQELDRFLARVNTNLPDSERSRGEVRFTVSDAAKELLVRKGYSLEFGGRNLRATVQSMVGNPLSERLLRHPAHAGDRIRIDARGNELTVRIHHTAKPPQHQLVA